MHIVESGMPTNLRVFDFVIYTEDYLPPNALELRDRIKESSIGQQMRQCVQMQGVSKDMAKSILRSPKLLLSYT